MRTDLLIRKATAADAGSIARLHATSWKSAYKNILPQEYLDNDLEGERESYWKEKMQNLKPNDFVLLAEAPTLVGFVAVWEVDEKGYPATVDNLHVLPEERGKKTGLLLLCLAAAELKQQGKNSFFLWAFDQNTSAIAFYLKAGAIPLDKSLYEKNGLQIPETRYGWPTLDGLLAIK